MSAETLATLGNTEVIDIDQDALGIQGLKYASEGGLETWFKPLAGGDWAVCFLNRSAEAKNIDFDWAKNVVNDDFAKRKLDASAETFKIKDLWAKKDLGTTKKALKASVPSHDVLMMRLSLVK
jgi:alpha-galactosidase